MPMTLKQKPLTCVHLKILKIKFNEFFSIVNTLDTMA